MEFSVGSEQGRMIKIRVKLPKETILADNPILGWLIWK